MITRIKVTFKVYENNARLSSYIAALPVLVSLFALNNKFENIEFTARMGLKTTLYHF